MSMSSGWQRWRGVMKAYPFEEKRLSKWDPPYIVQPKYDGVRCRAVPIQTGAKGDEYLLLSSEEHPIFSVPHINWSLQQLKLTAELDGELYCHGMSFEEIFSITSRTVNEHYDYNKIQLHVFDIVNDSPQMRRLIALDNLRGLSEAIKVSPFWLCESLDEVTSIFERVVKMGYEGIIVRHKLTPYERKRSTMIMKFKPKKEDTYEIVGVQEEISKDGIPKGSLGALRLQSGDGNVFSVGTGFTEELRQTLWSSKESIIGKVAKVKYQHLTSGRKVPRFPVFVSVEEKDE